MSPLSLEVPTPYSGLKVQLGDSFFHGGNLAVRFVRNVDPETIRVARINRDLGYLEWEEVGRNGPIDGATIVLDDDLARALLDALMRHYQGASDMQTVRADLLHERGRVDRLITALIDMTDKLVDN